MKDTDNKDVVAIPDEDKGAEDDDSDSDKFGFWQAFGFNTMMIFGTGPFISIPYTVSSVDPAGPHALVRYSIALVACICGELGSMPPYSGGSATYLRYLYGKARVFHVSLSVVAGPAEVASGFIAIAEYLVYFDADVLGYWPRVGISLGALAVSTMLLYRSNKEIGWVSVTLAAITIGAVMLAIILGFANFNSEYLVSPKEAFQGSAGKVLMSLAAATRFGVYDMTGYYNVCFMGDEVQNPKTSIPFSCITTAVVIGIIYLIVYIATMGVLDWRVFQETYNDDFDGIQVGIMSLFFAKVTNKSFAQFFTVIVVVTIFGSV